MDNQPSDISLSSQPISAVTISALWQTNATINIGGRTAIVIWLQRKHGDRKLMDVFANLIEYPLGFPDYLSFERSRENISGSESSCRQTWIFNKESWINNKYRNMLRDWKSKAELLPVWYIGLRRRWRCAPMSVSPRWKTAPANNVFIISLFPTNGSLYFFRCAMRRVILPQLIETFERQCEIKRDLCNRRAFEWD